MSHSSRPRLNIGAIREKSQSRSPSGLPIFSSAVQEKLHARSQSTWTTSLYLPIPGISNRRLRLPVPNLPWIHSSAVSKFGRRRGSVVVLVGLAFGLFLFYSLVHRIGGGEAPSFMRDPSTLVYSREDLQKIWKWEVESGHYPSRRESMCSSFALSSRLFAWLLLSCYPLSTVEVNALVSRVYTSVYIFYLPSYIFAVLLHIFIFRAGRSRHASPYASVICWMY